MVKSKSDSDVDVILVDDDKDLLEALSQAYELADFSIKRYRTAKQALQNINAAMRSVIVTDVRMPEMDGVEFFRKVREIDPEIPVIIMTGHADVPMVLSVLKEGVFSFLAKPIATEELMSTTERAIEKRALVLENRALKNLIKQTDDINGLIGETSGIIKLKETIRHLSPIDVDILIEGETGTEKEQIARMLHKQSTRKSQKFVSVNCAAIVPGTYAEELFGIDGRINSSYKIKKVGKIELADRGTLYLDKLDSIPKDLQGQFLNIVEKREITPLGAESSRYVDLKIIAACSPQLSKLVTSGEFRPDLFYRLNTIHLIVPPLRERREDLPLLFAHFLKLASDEFGRKIPHIKAETRRHIFEYDWPGNMQELENFAKSIVLGVNHNDNQLSTPHLSLPQRIEQFEASTIRTTLRKCSGDVTSTVKALGIPRKTFYDKVKRHNIDLKNFRENKTKS